jgi:hypothetical protein
VSFGGANTTLDPASLTPGWGAKDVFWLVLLTSGRSDWTVTSPPTNYTDLLEAATNPGSASTFDIKFSTARRQLNAASEDPDAWTVSGTTSNPIVGILAIQPDVRPVVTQETDNGAYLGATPTPTVKFSGEDPEGDDITYNIQISANSDMSSPLIDAESDADDGFVDVTNGADLNPFASGDEVSYTVQLADSLDLGNYYWRVRGKDPGGSNTYGEWSDIRIFALSAAPPAASTTSKKLTELDALGEIPANNDLLYVVDVSDEEHGPDGTSKKVTAQEVVGPSETTITSSATPTPTGHRFMNILTITALAEAAELQAPSGTPANGNKLLVRILDDGTSRALTYNAIYRGMADSLPAATTISKVLYMEFVYNSQDEKWDLVYLTKKPNYLTCPFGPEASFLGRGTTLIC